MSSTTETDAPVKICEECGKPFGRRYKQKFKRYQRQRFCSTTCRGVSSRRPIEERFWGNVDKSTSASGCWLWMGTTDTWGYGRIRYSGVGAPSLGAHAYAWRDRYGPVPDGMLVLHKCDTPHCVNPDHLFLGTDKDNTDDKIAKGRGYWLSGEDNPSAIMTKEGVAELRQLRQGGVIYRELAERFGISKSTARAIASGKIWPPAKDTPDEGMVYQQE